MKKRDYDLSEVGSIGDLVGSGMYFDGIFYNKRRVN